MLTNMRRVFFAVICLNTVVMIAMVVLFSAVRTRLKEKPTGHVERYDLGGLDVAPGWGDWDVPVAGEPWLDPMDLSPGQTSSSDDDFFAENNGKTISRNKEGRGNPGDSPQTTRKMKITDITFLEWKDMVNRKNWRANIPHVNENVKNSNIQRNEKTKQNNQNNNTKLNEVITGKKVKEEKTRNATQVSSDKKPGRYQDLNSNAFRNLVSEQGRPVVIIVMAQWRFGSSVIGELFNQNPGVMFLYEPLTVVEQLVHLWRLPGPYSKEAYYYSTKLLRDFARCDFSDTFLDVANQTNAWGGRFRNRALCEQAGNEDCRMVNAGWMQDICSKFQGHLAAKVIRADLGMIKPLIVEDKVNVKIIHLVRDPRGAMASRINYIHRIDNNELADSTHASLGRLELLHLLTPERRGQDSVVAMCQWLRVNVLPPKRHIPSWLRDHYYLLKYEDFAEHPLRTTEDLYSFAGLRLHESVRNWVVQHTQSSDADQGTFDVRRNASLTARRWMSELSLLEIRQVESKCSDVMKMLGYELYDGRGH